MGGDERVACHFAEPEDVEDICRTGLQPQESRGVGWRRRAEDIVEQSRPDRFPSRKKSVFLFPEQECERPPSKQFFGKIGSGEQLGLTGGAEEDDCGCFVGNFDMFTRVVSAIQRDDLQGAEFASEVYWDEAIRCGDVASCSSAAERSTYQDNLEIVCGCEIGGRFIQECP